MDLSIFSGILFNFTLQCLLFEFVILDDGLLQFNLKLCDLSSKRVLVACIDASKVSFEGLLVLLDTVHGFL